MAVETRPLTPDDWPLIERLFGANGACGGCWCMVWRVPAGGKAWQTQKGANNKRSFRKLVQSGAATGCLALAGDEPVGWCSVAPKRDFDYFRRSRTFEATNDPGVWAVSCFFVDRRWRGRGVAGALLEEAATLAADRGATEIEGFPVVPQGARLPSAFAWTGVPALFERHGFAPFPSKGKRPVYRKALAAPKRRAKPAIKISARPEKAPEHPDGLKGRARWFEKRAGKTD